MCAGAVVDGDRFQVRTGKPLWVITTQLDTSKRAAGPRRLDCHRRRLRHHVRPTRRPADPPTCRPADPLRRDSVEEALTGARRIPWHLRSHHSWKECW